MAWGIQTCWDIQHRQLISYGPLYLVCCRMVQHVLLENQLTPYATIQNRAGFWVLPSQANFTSIVNEMDFPSTTVSPDWVKVHLGLSGGLLAAVIANPVCAISSVLVEGLKDCMRMLHEFLMLKLRCGAEDPSAYPLSGLEFIVVNQNSKYMGTLLLSVNSCMLVDSIIIALCCSRLNCCRQHYCSVPCD